MNNSEFKLILRRAFAEFLALPTVIIAGFLLLEVSLYFLDHTELGWLEPARALLRARVFANAQATSDLLGTIASSLITVTSITISILLLALQQTASNMTSDVFDQFLRRHHNQVYFGFFVGLALYTLIILATVDEPFNPVFGATLAFLLTVVALYLLIVLLYTTINQMRPVEIIETIHDYTLAARRRQQDLVQKTRRQPRHPGGVSLPIRAPRRGFVTNIRVDTIDTVLQQVETAVEVVFHISIGSYVAFQDHIATVQAHTHEAAQQLVQPVELAVALDRQRDITNDPAYGIEQLQTIAWSSISSAKSDPAPGLLTVHSLRDILARWSSAAANETEDDQAPQCAAIVYVDNTFDQLLNAFEALAVISSESMQFQIFADVVHTFAVMFDLLPAPQQQRTEELILRILPALGDHVLTAELDQALADLVSTLEAAERLPTALAVRQAQAQLQRTVGELGSRATRGSQR
jgi:uncharacterized membrane protein